MGDSVPLFVLFDLIFLGRRSSTIYIRILSRIVAWPIESEFLMHGIKNYNYTILGQIRSSIVEYKW